MAHARRGPVDGGDHIVTLSWTAALVRRRPGHLLATAAGIALAVALLGSLGAFLTSAKAQMTDRAVAGVPVDWQVEIQPGASTTEVMRAVQQRPDVEVALPVGYGVATGIQATTAGTTQTTGGARVVGLPPAYSATFPGELRVLAGAIDGVLLAQQTAANLHAGPGDTIAVLREGQAPARLTVAGVVELPAADAFFQRIGVGPAAQATAPPDNVVLVPAAQWHALYDGIGASSDIRREQIHVRLHHQLPHDPSAAFTRTAGSGRRLEADLAGTALVGNNLAAALDAARSDSLYAQILFLLLGLPGAALAALLTRAMATAGGEERRTSFALLRTRGASLAQLQRLVAAEAGVVAVLGAVGGAGLAALVGRLAFGTSTFGATPRSALLWIGASVTAGLAIAVGAVGASARRDAVQTSVASARQSVGRGRPSLVLRFGLDGVLLVAAASVFWASSRNHYNLVLAPEGVATVSLNYWALAGPLLLWAGTGLLTWRLVDLVLGRGGWIVRRLLAPVAGGLVGPASSALRRQRGSLAAGIVLVVLSLSFAISTAVFNTTYVHQVGVDARLTNGADVVITEAPGAGATAPVRGEIARIEGVGHIEPLQHRFVYVGADLQDLYGVDPSTIVDAGQLQDGYFGGGTARALMAELASRPDAVLVSAETVQDFQLAKGDALRLRIRDAVTGDLVEVPFHYAGIVKEFPTAPTDSFIVANAAYVAERTGDPSISTLLVSAHRATPSDLARRLRPLVGPSATVSDLDHSRRVVGSSLTAVDLAGLTRLELSFALILVLAATGLVFGLGLAQRRRRVAIARALGASAAQRAVFARSEAVVFGAFGAVLGIAGGFVLAEMLVKVLTGVFDPPPEALALPWRYLALTAACAGAGLVGAVVAQGRVTGGSVAETLRDL